MCSRTFLGRVGVEVGWGVGGLCALYWYVFGRFNLRQTTYSYVLFACGAVNTPDFVWKLLFFALYVFSFIHSFIHALPGRPSRLRGR